MDVRRFVVLHPQAAADAAVLIASGACLLAGQVLKHGLLHLADWCDRRLAAATDLGTED